MRKWASREPHFVIRADAIECLLSRYFFQRTHAELFKGEIYRFIGRQLEEGLTLEKPQRTGIRILRRLVNLIFLHEIRLAR